jgi:hypothetical protein
MNSSLIWYIAWGAIPAVLSILLFLFTKSQASISTKRSAENEKGTFDDDAVGGATTILSRMVDNPFKHMIINVSGAAALFLILMFLMNPIKMGFYSKQSDWSMKVKFKDEKGQPIPISSLSAMELVPQPGKNEIYDEYTILVDLDDLLEENSRLKVNYDMRFFFEGFETISIPLKDSINSKKFCNRSLDSRTIELMPRNLVRRYKEASVVTTPDSSIQVLSFSLDN